MIALSSDLWTPQERGVRAAISSIEKGEHVCVWAPTGGGKTRMAAELVRYANSRGWGTVFYVNRRLLILQTLEKFRAQGVHAGVRASGHEDHSDMWTPNQISSEPTERHRVYKSKIWTLHDAQLVIVDEAHLQKSQSMTRVINDHKDRGATVVLLTATPVGLSHLADSLIISGTMREYRACKALVPALVRTIEQPDMSKVSRNQTGEYILNDRKRQIYTQSIVGNVIDNWKLYNKDVLPTAMYCPGVAESVWLVDQFQKAGIRFAHVDATNAVVDGKRMHLTRALWEDIVGQMRDGRLKGISCRFKLREGWDLPELGYIILATPIGSICSYLQTIGRGLRYSDRTPEKIQVQCHGGSYLTHGSPNHDRAWDSWWDLPEGAISRHHVKTITIGEEPEPIRCPECCAERLSGITCPSCGHTHQKSKRCIIQRDGTLVEKEGRLILPRKFQKRHSTQDSWKKMYWGYRKNTDRTFAQMEAWFCHEYGHWPPHDLDYMPTNEIDWYRRVKDVPDNRIRWPTETENIRD